MKKKTLIKFHESKIAFLEYKIEECKMNLEFHKKKLEEINTKGIII